MADNLHVRDSEVIAPGQIKQLRRQRGLQAFVLTNVHETVD